MKEVIMFNSRMQEAAILEISTNQPCRTALGLAPQLPRGWAKQVVLGFIAMIVLLLTASPTIGATDTTAVQLNNLTPVGSGFGYAFATTVDKSGNVYVSDYTGGAVYEIVADHGAVSASSTVTKLASLTSPQGIAVAPNGDLYVCATVNYQYVIEKIALSSNGAVSVFNSSYDHPAGLAFDASGNLFVADYSSYVYEFVATNGVISVSSTPLQVGSGYAHAYGVAVDASGNVFIGSGSSSSVYEVLASSSGFSSTSTTNAVGSSFSNPLGVAVDSAGNLYVADSMKNKVYEIAAAGGFSSTSTAVVLQSMTNPVELSADGNGNIFIATSSSSSILELSTTSLNFGTVAVGSSVSKTLTIRADSTGTLHGYNVLTNGAAGQDYTSTGGSCTVGTTYYAGNSCTINVTFAPQYAGQRNGSVSLLNSGGVPVFTVNLTGTGSAPQIAYLPGTQSAALNSTSLVYPDDIAIDNNGNLFVADESAHLCELPAGSSTCTALGTFDRALSVTVDGAGNLYVADAGDGFVYKLTLENGSYAQSEIGSGYSSSTGVAVDASGNVYVADKDLGVFKLTPTASGYVQSTVSTVSTGPDCPWGLTVDGSGNIFVANNLCKSGGAVYKLTPTGSSYTATSLGSHWSDPNGIKVDAAGNVYVADDDNGEVDVLTPSTTNGVTTYTQNPAISNSLGLEPEGLALDGKGNLYVTDSNNNNVYKFDYADAPSLSFANTVVGATSAAQTVSVGNIGNLPLNISAVTFPANFPEDSSDDDCMANTTVGPASGCTLTIDFHPTVAGANTGSVLLTDNALNATAAQQSISVSGTGTITLAPAALTSPTPGSTVSTSSVTFQWSKGTGTSGYQLCVGNLNVNNCNLFASGFTTALSASVTGIPLSSEVLYVRLYSKIGTVWQPVDYTYTMSGTPVAAALTSPTPGTGFNSSSVTFQWTAGSGVQGYILMLGTSKGGHDLFNGPQTTATSVSATGLPTSGGIVYARLFSRFDGVWSLYNDYTYTVTSPGTLTTPTAGAVFTGSSQTFTWSPVAGASGYALWLGTTAGAGNLFNGHTTGNSITASSLPINGQTIYARLYTTIGSVTVYSDTTFTAVSPATLINPTPGATLGGSSQTFSWTPLAGATAYALWLGTTPGSGNLLNAHTTAPTVTVTATNLPVNGATIYARLYTNFNGVYGYTETTFTAK
jgi:sugar lactone lactonase YvrE